MSRYSPSPPDDRRYMRSPPKDRYRGRSPPPRSSGGRRRGTSKDKYSGCLFIGNIPYYFKEKHIRDLFYKIGGIENITIGVNRNTGQPKGHAFVQFYNYRDAQEAHYRFQGNRIDGRALHIDWDAGMRTKMRSYPRRPMHPYDRPGRRYSRSPSLSPGESRSYRGKRDSQSPRRSSRSPHGSPSHRGSPRGSRSPTRPGNPPNGSPSLKHSGATSGSPRKHEESSEQSGRYRQSEVDGDYQLSPRTRDEPITTSITSTGPDVSPSTRTTVIQESVE